MRPARVARRLKQTRSHDETEDTMSATTERRELAYRVTDGINVSLLWTAVGDRLTLEVYDERTGEFLVCDVPRDRALHAFHHPYVYVGSAPSCAPPPRLAA
jgi:hypothetical protein